MELNLVHLSCVKNAFIYVAHTHDGRFAKSNLPVPIEQKAKQAQPSHLSYDKSLFLTSQTSKRFPFASFFFNNFKFKKEIKKVLICFVSPTTPTTLDPFQHPNTENSKTTPLLLLCPSTFDYSTGQHELLF